MMAGRSKLISRLYTICDGSCCSNVNAVYSGTVVHQTICDDICWKQVHVFGFLFCVSLPHAVTIPLSVSWSEALIPIWSYIGDMKWNVLDQKLNPVFHLLVGCENSRLSIYSLYTVGQYVMQKWFHIYCVSIKIMWNFPGCLHRTSWHHQWSRRLSDFLGVRVSHVNAVKRKRALYLMPMSVRHRLASGK